MALRFVYGNDYGGAESSQHAYDSQLGSNYFNSLSAIDRRHAQAAAEAEARARSDQFWANLTFNRQRGADTDAQHAADLALHYAQLQAGQDTAGTEAEFKNRQLEQNRILGEQQIANDRLRAERPQQDYAAARDHDMTFTAALGVAKQKPFNSTQEVLSQFPNLTPSDAAVIVAQSQATRSANVEDYELANSLAKAMNQQAIVAAQKQSTIDAEFSGWNPLNWPAKILGALTPGPSVSSQLEKQAETYGSEASRLAENVASFKGLQKNYPLTRYDSRTGQNIPLINNPAANAVPVPRTIIPVTGPPDVGPARIPFRPRTMPPPPVQAAAPTPWPSSAGFDPQSLSAPPAVNVPSTVTPRANDAASGGYIAGRVYGGKLFLGGDFRNAANWRPAR